MLFTKEYIQQLKEARNAFIEENKRPDHTVRDVIQQSWIRSKSFGIDPEDTRAEILSQTEIQKKITENQLLYDTASSFMEYLYQLVKGSGFMIIFADREGYILNSVGDPDILKIAQTQSNPLVIGSCRSEAALGTNAVGTPLCTGKPIQIFAYEHYITPSSDWTCSGAPVIVNGQIVGVLALSGNRDRVHPHTLGMVMAASEAISREIHLKAANTQLTDLKNQLQTAIDSIHSGAFLLDEHFKVSLVNSLTLSALECKEEDLMGHSYREFFPDLKLEEITDNIYDYETTISGKNKPIKCFISVKSVHTSRFSNKETFLISFRKTEHIRSLVNKVIGSDARYDFDNIIGSCPAMTRTKELARLVAGGNTTVLITGESGTGKELFAHALHNNSSFSGGPFVAINCGAIPKELIESELFGYEAGAFTGAKKEGRAGKFELANEGTIFLDEIGDMPYDVQIRLLRVLQERCVTRVGGKKSIPLNIRVIAATNCDLEEAIREHTFRRDLYYRLNVFNLHIPPLRERGDDIMLLTRYFLEKYRKPEYDPITRITPEVEQIFLSYPWMGNIRELENTIERVCILTQNGILSPEALPHNMKAYPLQESGKAVSVCAKPFHTDTDSCQQQKAHPEILSADESEQRLIIEHLKNSGGNIKKAAESLGISRRTLYRKLEKYHINSDELRQS
ncbi:(S)-limonene 6-monooxygenase [uncultured Roseburia sp.]|uniref:Sigma-54-dependent Fis family transcriptional regulator n=1 Tax=Brotonthovivens ammoniilytica TaxID=2981725 RepID=A0ABT2TMH3_9FIRM|nr:sigma-54-dependent Fis family transcriptional regulator [Brotonthovivens ammoniilytica]MCU6762986.1 sigma-54-dependent Fis family transcriptional regulator [Brotonthovivens ammoniilytica]SCI99578.1 (S)-limonene 6-monooxygenase [uncultured Roseburia sp.]